MEWTMGPPDTWDKMRNWLAQLGQSIRPRAIVVVSGHWEEREFTINNGAHPPMLYDYSGFPPETYRIKYNAPGSPEVAQRVHDLLDQSGISSGFDSQRGYDHGVFVPLKVAYPKADIPIVQLSLKKGLDPQTHIAAGRALAPLRREGVLIVGSGMSYHNMRGFMMGQPVPASDRFDSWLTAAVSSAERNEKLKDWQHAPDGREAHPREEHLIPLLVASGAAEGENGKRVFSDRVMGATVSAYQFGNI
jgi:aromatic ring-opening dioxygenase catalytic subunit (LigB family)